MAQIAFIKDFDSFEMYGVEELAGTGGGKCSKTAKKSRRWQKP